MNKLIFNWSGGKDSALALYYLLQEGNWDIVGLLTTVNDHYNRITMHGVRHELLEQQADILGFEQISVRLPEQPSMETYEQLLPKCCTHCGTSRDFPIHIAIQFQRMDAAIAEKEITQMLRCEIPFAEIVLDREVR